MSLEVNISSTPNQNALKFSLNQIILDSGHKTFNNPEEANQSPLAKRLFEIDGVASVFLIQDFITITKTPETSWLDLQDKVVEAIKEVI